MIFSRKFSSDSSRNTCQISFRYFFKKSYTKLSTFLFIRNCFEPTSWKWFFLYNKIPIRVILSIIPQHNGKFLIFPQREIKNFLQGFSLKFVLSNSSSKYISSYFFQNLGLQSFKECYKTFIHPVFWEFLQGNSKVFFESLVDFFFQYCTYSWFSLGCASMFLTTIIFLHFSEKFVG